MGKIVPVRAAADDRIWTEEDFDLLDEFYAAEARDNLWAFRQYVDPGLLKGWFPYDLSNQLQTFYNQLVAGMRPKLVIEAPPQHGKSRGLQDFIAWVAGKSPEYKTIYASYSDDLGVSTNMYLQRMYDDRSKYGRVFPDTMISATNVVTAVSGAGRFLRNSSFLEYVSQKGSFRNVTVEGQVTGKGLDIGIIDDPLKGRKEAQSKTIRNNAWMWLMDDFFNRFSEYAGLIITMTRWHVDDPAGRFLAHFPDAIVVKYPALSLSQEARDKLALSQVNAANDPRDEEGLPLFPEFKSKAFLMERKSAYTQASWESLYQQSPIIAGGGTFPIEAIKYRQNAPAIDDIKKAVRYWDKAGTEGGGAYTAGVLMFLLTDGSYYIADVRRGQWSALEREKHIKATAEMDEASYERLVKIWVEQEPGSGGKESAERTVAMLAGHSCRIDKVTGSKETRAEPYAAQWQGGNVHLHVAKWNEAFVDEHETFPSGHYKDQVDAAAGAFAKLVAKHYNYDGSLSWVAG